MTRRHRSIALAVLVSLAVAASASAQATRTWVSGVGDDANPCSRTAPCKTFAGAISKTAAGGEISVLDPGGFGAVTITKSITINGDGTLAGILASLVNGVIVNAGVNDKVILRNITINGANNGLNGIRYLAGANLTLENVDIYGFQNNVNSRCIDVALTNTGELIVNDSSLTNCANGVRLSTTAGTLFTSFNNVQITNVNSHALEVAAGVTFAAVRNSTFADNGGDGARVSVNGGIINLEGNMIAFNGGTAVNAAVSGARLRISNNTILNNGGQIGIAAGGFVQSPGNNRIEPAAVTPPNQGYNQQ
jgi:hypothetical protein